MSKWVEKASWQCRSYNLLQSTDASLGYIKRVVMKGEEDIVMSVFDLPIGSESYP
jgi:hypothetical protein